jgi:hypothetical protein
MIVSNRILVFLIFTALIYSACEPLEKVSDVPEITYKSFKLFEIDTLSMVIKAGELKFNFIDGDADLGVSTQSSEDTLNFFLIPYQKLDGEYIAAEDMDTLKYRIRDDEKLRREGQNKTIKGEIKLIIYYFVTPPYDTIRYDFYIVDRAHHQSNIESTEDIGFN